MECSNTLLTWCHHCLTGFMVGNNPHEHGRETVRKWCVYGDVYQKVVGNISKRFNTEKMQEGRSRGGKKRNGWKARRKGDTSWRVK